MISLRHIPFLALVLLLSCTEERSVGIVPNTPPETHIAISGDSLSATLYQQTMNWWGDDIDGYIVGYYYTWVTAGAPDTLWTWTTQKKESFPNARYALPVGNQTEEYYFIVKAVDNTATFVTAPTDSTPPIKLDGAVDPSPAVQKFPLFNNRPSVSFQFVSGQGPGSKVVVPDTSFPVATFKWKARDADVGDYVSKVEIRGDWEPAGVWHGPFPAESLYTFRDIPTGPGPVKRTVRLRAYDGGGASSNYVTQDSSDIIGSGPYAGAWNVHSWMVKPLRGSILLIDDWDELQGGEGDDSFYSTTLNAAYPNNVTVWNINYRLNGIVRRSGLYTYEGDTKEVFSTFSTILWYTNFSEASPNLSEARRVIIDFLLRSPNPGNFVLISSSVFGNTAKNFALPNDSLIMRDIFRVGGLSNPDMRLQSGVSVTGRNAFTGDILRTQIFLTSDGLSLVGDAEPVFIGTDVRSVTSTVGMRYMGTEPGKPYKHYILAFPLNRVDGNGNAATILTKIIDSF